MSSITPTELPVSPMYVSISDIPKSTDLSIQNSNIKKIRDLEGSNYKVFSIVYSLNSYILPKSFDNSLFTNPKYIQYRPSINYNYYEFALYDTQKVRLPISGTNIKTLPSTYGDLNFFLADIDNTAVLITSTMKLAYNIPIQQNMVLTSGGEEFTVKNAFAQKIYAYITISTPDTYRISSSDNIRIFLNNYPVFTNTSGTNTSSNIYLNTGIYFVYIEKFSHSNDKVLNITLNRASETTTKPIDDFLISYTPFTTATTNRDNSLISFCGNDNNLYGTNNICSNSLTNNTLLNKTLLDKCVPNNVLSKDPTTQKMNTNCLEVYNRSKTTPSTLNSTIKNNFDTAYDNWATNVAVTNNNIKNGTNDNVEALAEFLNVRTPTETQFGFVTYIQDYCEKNVNEYDVLTSSNNLCKNQYNRTYTNNTNINNKNISIQNVKNKFCNPNENLNNITNTNCTSEYNKNNPFLGDEWAKFCFNSPTSANPTLKDIKSDGTLSDNCVNLYTNAKTHSTIKNKILSPWKIWANNTINTTDNKILANNENSLTQYNDILMTDLTDSFGSSKTPTDTLISYCEGKYGDNFNPPNETTSPLCNLLYTKSRYNTNSKITNSTTKMKQNYCTKIGSDGKPRYENDLNCQKEYTTNILTKTINDRCIKNGQFQYVDQWCTSQSNNNLNSSTSPYKEMREARTNNLSTAISNIKVQKYTDNLFLNNNDYNYAINQYATTSDKKLPDQLLTSKLFDYCENQEPNYPTNPKSQCKGIYDKYNNEYNVKLSQNNMQQKLCKQSENILNDTKTQPLDPVTNLPTTNIYNCKETIFNTSPPNLDLYAPTVNSYCNADKISSTECQTYYNDIENKILTSLNLKISQPTSSFANKLNKNIHDYEHNIELSGFENGTQPGSEQPGSTQPGSEQPGSTQPGSEQPGSEQPGSEQPGSEQPGAEQPGSEQPGAEQPGSEQPGSEQPGAEQPGSEQPGSDNIFDIEITSCQLLNDSLESSYDWFYLLLVFIFIMLIVILFSTCLCYKKKKTNPSNDLTQNTTPTK